MTSNTLWTQQMLNILISWLRDHTHTHTPAAQLPPIAVWARGGPKQLPSPQPPTHLCHLLLLSSPPFSFSVSICRPWGLSGSWATGNTGVWAVIRVSVTAEEAEDWRWTDTWSVVAAAPLWDDWSRLLAPEIKINRTSCLYSTLCLDSLLHRLSLSRA